MGCCISKRKPKKPSPIDDESDNIQDKAVISQAPKIPKAPIHLSNKISPCPLSPTTSATSSVSSFTCASSSNTISSCSSLSSGSSTSNVKDHRAFSNEFLWSCIKENPHIIRINSIKEHSQLVAPQNVHARKLESLAKQVVAVAAKQSIPQKGHGSATQKYIPSHSPRALSRQKSFGRELERIDSSCSLPSRTTRLQSPSLSRRFSRSRDNTGGVSISMPTPKGTYSRRAASSNVNSSLRKENLNNLQSCSRNTKTCIHRISSKIDEIAVEEALAHHENDSILVEDIDNPLISLDCFIFL